MAATVMLQNYQGERPKKRQTKDLQDKLCNLCKDCWDGRKAIHLTLTQGFMQDQIFASHTFLVDT